jgi:hypothetical protein
MSNENCVTSKTFDLKNAFSHSWNDIKSDPRWMVAVDYKITDPNVIYKLIDDDGQKIVNEKFNNEVTDLLYTFIKLKTVTNAGGGVNDAGVVMNDAGDVMNDASTTPSMAEPPPSHDQTSLYCILVIGKAGEQGQKIFIQINIHIHYNKIDDRDGVSTLSFQLIDDFDDFFDDLNLQQQCELTFLKDDASLIMNSSLYDTFETQEKKGLPRTYSRELSTLNDDKRLKRPDWFFKIIKSRFENIQPNQLRYAIIDFPTSSKVTFLDGNVTVKVSYCFVVQSSNNIKKYFMFAIRNVNNTHTSYSDAEKEPLMRIPPGSKFSVDPDPTKPGLMQQVKNYFSKPPIYGGGSVRTGKKYKKTPSKKVKSRRHKAVGESMRAHKLDRPKTKRRTH